MPIIHTGPSDISARLFIDVRTDRLDSFSALLGIVNKLLQAKQDRHDFIATFQVEPDIGDRAFIESVWCVNGLTDSTLPKIEG